jgi:hypothetical protein
MRLTLFAVTTALLIIAFTQAAFAITCSGWKAICIDRGGARYAAQCDAKFRGCLSSGCFTEGVKYGGGRHCGITKK